MLLMAEDNSFQFLRQVCPIPETFFFQRFFQDSESLYQFSSTVNKN